jgi:DNA polymerase III delta prime subunit
MPHQLYVGSPGSGKTTTARILIDHILQQKDDLLILNGSEQRSIQIVRDIIMEFAKSPAIFSPIKIVFIDEADNLTPDAWKALRFIIEKYSADVKFIFTGNIDNFPDYIHSRCKFVQFKTLPKDYMISFAKSILDKEGIQYEEKDVIEVINKFYPDLRKIVNTLQDLSRLNNKLDMSRLSDVMTSDDILLQLTKELIISLLSKDNRSNMIVIKISKVISTAYIDYVKVFKTLFRSLSFEAVPLKVLISRYANRLNHVLEPSMLYYEFVHELVKVADKLDGFISPNNVFVNQEDEY